QVHIGRGLSRVRGDRRRKRSVPDVRCGEVSPVRLYGEDARRRPRRGPRKRRAKCYVVDTGSKRNHRNDGGHVYWNRAVLFLELPAQIAAWETRRASQGAGGM